ncbi:MAG: hypothetical protein Q9191_003873 [Dirinaria sp. TL-2023a]
MAVTVGFSIGALSLLLVLYKAINLFNYVKQAKQTELPYTIVPVLETEILGKVFTPLLRIAYHNRLARGEGWPRWCRFTMLDWAWEEKRRVHEEYGEVFLVVSPEGIICYSADADMSWDVMHRRNEFTKPRDKYKVLEPYGPNVATTEGKEYNFHVRITAPPFNDGSGANDLVWKEAARQTRQLMDSWSKQGSTRDLSLDINRLTLGVISYTGFGQRLDFTDEISDAKSATPQGYKLSLLHVLHTVVTHMIKILLYPKWFMKMTPMAGIALAHTELEKYMRAMIKSETAKLEKDAEYQSSDARGNLLNSVLRASAKEGAGLGQGRKHAFSEDEVLGNLFLYLLAGYETTANAITYGLITLALRQDLQHRVIAEIDRVYDEANAGGRTELSYSEDFEKLEYTFGFMYETFRLYPGVTIITKMISKPATISVYPENGEPRQHILPAQCRVYLNVNAVHYHERYWPQPWEIRPERWMNEITVKGPDAEASGKKIDASDRARQVRGTLMTFSGGARACLGRKFAQSEYISMLATLLREYRVVLGEGVKAETVKREIDMLASGGVTLSPLNYVKLALEKRVKA